MARILQKSDITKYTFHSFRRSSATAAADNGATVQQMQDFFGWKSASMTMEYISTSKSAVQSMASSLYPPENVVKPEYGLSGKAGKMEISGMSGF